MFLNQIGINIAPFGVRLSGGAELFSLKLNFNVLLARLSQKLVFAADLAVPGDGINRFVARILGPAAPMLQIVEMVSLDLTFSTASVPSLSEFPSLAWPGVPELRKGIGMLNAPSHQLCIADF